MASKFKEREEAFKARQDIWKAEIRKEPKRFKRFWLWVWYLVAFPFVWIIENIRDWRTAVIFVIVVLVVGCEVWVPFLIGLITQEAYWFGIAATCETFWMMPGTPFLVICIGLTAAIKAIFNKIRSKRK